MDTSSRPADNAGVFGTIRFVAHPKLSPAGRLLPFNTLTMVMGAWHVGHSQSIRRLLRALLVLYFLFMLADAVVSAILGQPIGRIGQQESLQ